MMFEEDEEYFDFENKSELPEELDFKHLKPCPYCEKPIPEDSISCLYCGNSLPLSTKKPAWMAWILVFLVICTILLAVF